MINASLGQSYNQFMVQHVTIAGKSRAFNLKPSPIDEKHIIICKFYRTLIINSSYFSSEFLIATR